MSKAYSITEARSNLASIVHSAETGEAIELTRRGHAVAAIISIEDYKVIKEKKFFFERLNEFYKTTEKSPLNGDELDVRDMNKGRDFTW